MTDKRTAVLIVGMHRSGTSYVSSLCQAFGIGHASAQMPGNDWNRPGYFEAMETFAAHETLMGALQRPWWDITAWPEDWQERVAARACASRLVAFMNALPDGDVAVKDPRISLLLPLWREVCRKCGFRPALLVCMRPAGEVAASLQVRDDINALLGLAIWWRHVDAICRELARAPLPHAFVFYRRALAEPAYVHGLLRSLDARVTSPNPETDAAAGRIADPSLHHQQTTPADIVRQPFLAVCEEIYAAIEEKPEVALGAPDLVGADWMRKFMTWYPHWRSLYLRHNRLLQRTRNVYDTLDQIEAIGGPGD